jgi:hypothetical protein
MTDGIKFCLHNHTHYSPCSNLDPLEFLMAAEKSGLNAVVVTDHGTTEGALGASALWRLYPDRFKNLRQVYNGIEVRTQYGEINLVFLSVEECGVIEELRQSDGRYDLRAVVHTVRGLWRDGSEIMVGLNHPFSYSWFSRRGGFDFTGVREDGIFPSVAELALFIGFVELNANNLSWRESLAALSLAEDLSTSESVMPVVCNNDAHFRGQVGRYYTVGAYATPRESILAARRGDSNALVIPQRINHWPSRWYRFRSGARKLFGRMFA